MSFPEPIQFNGSDVRDLPPVETSAEERDRELEWARMEADARDFIQQHGPGALLRCISRALDSTR